jgi:uncharacterized membrane protein
VQQGKILWSHYLVMACYGLLLLALAMSSWLSAVFLLPFAWGVWKQNWHAHVWLCFVLLFYFLMNVNTLAARASALVWAETALIVLLFTSAMLYCRWSKPLRNEKEPL